MTSPGARRVRRLAALTVVTALVALPASPSWTAPAEPVPVKAKPGVVEVAPTATGAWFGWSQDAAGTPEHYDLYLQRGDHPRIKVNARRTQGLSGGVVGRHVYYAQQVGGRSARIHRLDLNTGRRTALPSKVNHRLVTVYGDPKVQTVRGDVSVSGQWVL